YREDTRRPEMSTVYVRLTGQFDHQQVLAVLHRETPKWQIQETVSLGTRTAIIQAPNTPLVGGLVGDTDVILTGCRGGEGAELEGLIREVLQLRDGHGTRLTKARSMDLQLAPPNACWLLLGRMHDLLRMQLG